MATSYTGTLTFTLTTLDEYNTLLSQIQADSVLSNIITDEINLKITCDVNVTG